jgi:hypothetical protein
LWGNSPSRLGCKRGSFIRSASLFIPRASEISWKRILTNIREDDVVASSVMTIADMQCQPMASEANMWPKNRATFLSLFVS